MGQGGETRSRAQPEPGPAQRVTLRCHNGSWLIDSVVPTSPTIVPASDRVADLRPDERVGAWFDVVDRSGRTLYRRRLDDPHYFVIDEHVGERTVARGARPSEPRLSVLAPVPAGGGRLEVYVASPPEGEPGPSTGPARLVAIVQLNSGLDDPHER